jgi:hypothetical protein
MTILDSCEVIGQLTVAMGDGSDPVGNGLQLVQPPAWVVGNLGPLWVPGNKRGSDVLMPGAVGLRPFRRRPTVTTHSMPMVVSGDYDFLTLDPCPPDPWVALEHNLLYLATNLLADPGTRWGTRDSILTMPSGALRFAAPHYLRITPVTVEQAVLVGNLEVSIPEGWFQLAESPAESPGSP